MYCLTHCFSKLLFNLGHAGALLMGVASVWVREPRPLASALFLGCRARAQPPQLMHLVALRHVDSSRIRDRTCASCTGGQVPNRQSTREGWVCSYDCAKTPRNFLASPVVGLCPPLHCLLQLDPEAPAGQTLLCSPLYVQSQAQGRFMLSVCRMHITITWVKH